MLSFTDISCDDMEGYLKIFVLNKLKGNAKSGYELMKDFELSTGSRKPSPGTIYPLLNDLLKRGFLNVSKKPNKKNYTLSKKGETFLARIMQEQKKAIERRIKLCGLIYNPSEIKKMRKSFEVMNHKKGVLANDIDVLNMLRGALIGFASSKKYSQRRKEFRKIIKRSSDKIMELAK